MTDYHVVAVGDDEEQLEINGSIASAYAPTIPLLRIAKDETQDVALLQLMNSNENYRKVSVGDPSQISEGTTICSMGFPLNIEFNSSRGQLNGKAGEDGRWTSDMPSNKGESGAPVFDLQGRVIAIREGGYINAQNLNLLTPINRAFGMLLIAGALPKAGDGQSSQEMPRDLPSGGAILFNGFRNYEQSMFQFSSKKILSWGTSNADIGVANPDANGLAQFFLLNDAPPYTDANAAHHDIANAGIIEMSTLSLDDIKQAPASDYRVHYFAPQLNHIYCVRTSDGQHFAKIKVTGIWADRISFEYVYQPSGSRNF